MLRLSPRLLIATAGALVGLGARAEDSASGGLVARLRGERSTDEQPPPGSWDVPFIQHCGYWSHFDYRSESSAWPVIGPRTPTELATFGLAHGVVRDAPEEGDVFLQFSPRRQGFVHAGIVMSIIARSRYSASEPYFDVDTIEGDTDECGHLRGGLAMRVRRRLSPVAGDRFLRWVELDAYDRLMTRSRVLSAVQLRRSA